MTPAQKNIQYRLNALYDHDAGGPFYSRRILGYCYNPLLDYGAAQTRRLEYATQTTECGGDPEEAEAAQRRLDAAAQIIADFYFDGNTADALDVIQAQANFRDLETQTADALTLCAPPDKDPGEVIAW